MSTTGLPEWDAGSYHRVSDPQVAWGMEVLDCLDLRGDETVLDAGCGTGRLTARLVERLPRGRVIAVDLSPAMLRAAHDHLADTSRAWCVRAGLLDLPCSGCADAVFSTATFHWVPDHPRLFAQLYGALRPDGRLVAQCGGLGNLEALHQRVHRVMTQQPFAGHAAGWADPWEFADAATTAKRLAAAGFVEIETWINEAPTLFTGPREYADFVAAVVLRLYLARLPSRPLRERLLADVTDLAAGDDPPYCLDYRRLNLRARRP